MTPAEIEEYEKIKKDRDRLLLQNSALKAALFAECRGIRCSKEGCYVGYRSCSGCEARAKAAHGPGWGDFANDGIPRCSTCGGKLGGGPGAVGPFCWSTDGHK